jgi:hypothetical protein
MEPIDGSGLDGRGRHLEVAGRRSVRTAGAGITAPFASQGFHGGGLGAAGGFHEILWKDDLRLAVFLAREVPATWFVPPRDP